MKIYPLKFRPIFKERIWGGQVLKSAFNKSIPEGAKIGESWELADLPEDKSVVVNGDLAGQTIDAVIEQFKVAIAGDENYQGPFPLLIKILDARDDLSVQVHPDLDTCKRTGKGDPKTECWYIIAADKGASIYKGLKPGTTRAQFAEAIENGNCAELLERIEVQIGQCHFLPSGTAHAIGKGLLIAEIQQPSDTTYRVFDWNRVDDQDNPRQLHVDDAVESIHFDPSGDDLTVRSEGRLVDTDVFRVDKVTGQKDSQTDIAAGLMRVLVFIEGSGSITSNETEPVEFVKGDTILVPAQFAGRIEYTQDCQYLIATV